MSLNGHRTVGLARRRVRVLLFALSVAGFVPPAAHAQEPAVSNAPATPAERRRIGAGLQLASADRVLREACRLRAAPAWTEGGIKWRAPRQVAFDSKGAARRMAVSDRSLLDTIVAAAGEARRAAARRKAQGDLDWVIRSYPLTPQAYEAFKTPVAFAPGFFVGRRVENVCARAQQPSGDDALAGQLAYHAACFYLYEQAQYGRAMAWADRYMGHATADRDRGMVLKALCHVNRGEASQATLLLATVWRDLAASPLYPQAALLGARARLLNQDIEGARPLLESALAHYPRDPRGAAAQQADQRPAQGDD